MENDISPDMELTLRTVAMPADSNPVGDIFGGWVMAQMDIAAGIRAGEYTGGRIVTLLVNQMLFKAPVKVGDILCVYTRIEKVGRSSITIAVEARVRRFHSPERVKVTEAEFVMVAVDDQGKPRQAPPLQR